MAALGIVFGDIATSPLYALRETLAGPEGVGVDRTNVLAVLGVRQVLLRPEVLVAVDPRYGLRYFAANGMAGFASLGSVFLVVTGGEALYADMGHVGVKAIRRGWFGIVMPALVLDFGQGALLLRDPGAIDNPLFRMGPDWAAGPLVVLATAATVIASQALISGAFSLTMQAVQIDHLPRMTIRQTSREHPGQIYVPVVNWLLMVACVALVLGFRSSSRLAAAYGVAVTVTMAVTTILFAVVAVQRLGWSRRRATLVAALFVVVDLAFVGANLLKIPDGGWFPLVVAAVVFLVMRTWHDGRRLVARRMRRDRVPARQVLRQAVASGVTRVPGTAFYLHPTAGQTPPALLANLRAHHVLHEQVVLVRVSIQPVPQVPRASQATVSELGEGLLQLEVRFGFDQRADLAAVIRDQEGPVFDLDDAVFVVGREHLTSTARPRSLSGFREHLFIWLHRNAADAASWYGLPAHRVIEVGSRVEL